MNAYTFDRHSLHCPVCHRTSGLPSVKMVGGLLTCPHCRARLVVSFSGHYVRDPFHARRSSKNAGKLLRRQSRPFARILRDSGVSKHSSFLAMLGSLLLLGFTMSFLSTSTGAGPSLQSWMQQVIKISEISEPPR